MDLEEHASRSRWLFKAVAAVVGNDAVVGNVVVGNDGNPLVDVDGVDAPFCLTRRRLLTRIGDELNFWGRAWRRRHGGTAVPITTEDTSDEDDSTDGFGDSEQDEEEFEEAREGADDEVNA
jgi:hypothetical protein